MGTQKNTREKVKVESEYMMKNHKKTTTSVFIIATCCKCKCAYTSVRVFEKYTRTFYDNDVIFN